MIKEVMDNETDYQSEKSLREGKEEELARLCGLR
jgi:hypothetical protein